MHCFHFPGKGGKQIAGLLLTFSFPKFSLLIVDLFSGRHRWFLLVNKVPIARDVE